MQNVGRVFEHRRRGLSIKTPLVHFSHLSDKVGLHAARVLKKLRQSAEKFIIGNRFEFEFGIHAQSINPTF
jgi:hypothetical protein